MCFGFRVETFSDHFIVEPGGRIFRAFQGMLNPRDPNYVNRIDDIAIFVSVELFSFLYLKGSNLSGDIFLKI